MEFLSYPFHRLEHWMCPQPNFDHEDKIITLGNSEAINGRNLGPWVTLWGRDSLPSLTTYLVTVTWERNELACYLSLCIFGISLLGDNLIFNLISKSCFLLLLQWYLPSNLPFRSSMLLLCIPPMWDMWNTRSPEKGIYIIFSYLSVEFPQWRRPVIFLMHLHKFSHKSPPYFPWPT